MATTFLEPGGDADFLVGTTNGFWSAVSGAAIATDYVHGGHQKSIQGGGTKYVYKNSVLADAGTRLSFYVYIKAYPTSGTAPIAILSTGSVEIVHIRLTSAGVLRLYAAIGPTQIGSNGPTLNTGQWYRISLAYTITSSTVNRFESFVNGVSAISVTNASLTLTGTSRLYLGDNTSDATLNVRFSDIYIDNSSALTDPGDIWVTAKRPNANGTTNGFTTQIGSGGSGYGSGHSPQINERPLSTTNGWSMVGAGSAVTEEYNVEASNVGDIDISTATIVDWLGWASMNSLAGETVQMVVGGENFSQAITTTATLYTKIKGSATYPAGTGTDIGITTDTSLTTVSLYECGIIFAYLPPTTINVPNATQGVQLWG